MQSSGAPIAGAAVNMGAVPLVNGAQQTDTSGLATLATILCQHELHCVRLCKRLTSESVVGYTTGNKPLSGGTANFTPIQLQSLSQTPTKGSLAAP